MQKWQCLIHIGTLETRVSSEKEKSFRVFRYHFALFSHFVRSRKMRNFREIENTKILQKNAKILRKKLCENFEKKIMRKFREKIRRKFREKN